MTTTLMERAKTIQEAEHQDNEAWRAQQMTTYRDILKRQDDPLEADAENLLTVVGDLRLSQGQVEADAKLVATFQRLSASAVQYEALHVLEVKARGDLKCLRRESERAIQVADVEQGRVSGRASASLNARAQLELLQRQRPDLFPASTG